MLKKRSTAQEVAELAAMSCTTVSVVLNNVPGIHIVEGTRQCTLKAARQQGYHSPATARRMVTRQTKFTSFVARHLTGKGQRRIRAITNANPAHKR